MSRAAEYLPVLLRSVWYALASCVICLLVGYPVAYVIAQTGASTQRVLYLLVTLPMCMSFLLRTLAWVALLRDTGIINSFLANFGIGPLPLIRNSGSVIAGMVYTYLPYMIMPLYTVIAKLDPRLIEAAQDLGCDSKQVFRRVILPLSMPGIISGHHDGLCAGGVYLLYLAEARRYEQHDDRRRHRAAVQGFAQPEPRRGDEPHTHGAGVHQHLAHEPLHRRGRRGGGHAVKRLGRIWTVIVYIFLYAPMVILFIGSFNDGKDLSEFEGFTFDNYADLFRNSHLLGLLLNSLILAVCAAALATVLGTLAAWHTGCQRQAAAERS